MIRTNAAPVVCFSDPDICARFMAAAVRSTPRHHTRSSVARISLGKTTSAARAGRQRAYCTPAGQRSKGGSVAAGTRHGRRGHTISITSLTISCTVLEQSSTVPVPNKLGSGCTRLQKQVRHGALGRGRRKGRETRICVSAARAAIPTATEFPLATSQTASPAPASPDGSKGSSASHTLTGRGLPLSRTLATRSPTRPRPAIRARSALHFAGLT